MLTRPSTESKREREHGYRTVVFWLIVWGAILSVIATV